MTHTEFSAIMAYLAAGIGKPIPQATQAVYWDLLGDLSAEALQAAAKQALLDSAYPTLPQVSVLRQLALAVQQPTADSLSPIEAWELVRKAMIRWGYFRPKQGLESLPPLVRRAVEAFGWQELCDAENADVIRAQFCRAYEAMRDRQQREALMPPSLRGLIDKLANRFTLPPPGPERRDP